LTRMEQAILLEKTIFYWIQAITSFIRKQVNWFAPIE